MTLTLPSFYTLTEQVKDYYAQIDIDNLKQKYNTAKQFTISFVSVCTVAFVTVSNQMHRALKQLVIILRWLADQCERADQGLELLKSQNQVFVSCDTDTNQETMQTAYPQSLSDIAKDLNQYSNRELMRLTGIKSKQSKVKLINAYLSMPI
jgi:hypothetical protein